MTRDTTNDKAADPSMNGKVDRAAILGGKAKPARMPVIADNLPRDVVSFDRWLGWDWKWDPKKNGGKGKWDKPPKNARNGSAGSSTNEKTWCDFSTAFAAADAEEVDGVGIALGELEGGRTLSGIDLDDCRDPVTGEIADWATAIIRLINSYTEISPSGTGVKILFFGTLPPGTRKAGDVECYCTGRYFTITGNIIESGPTELRDASIEVEQFYQAYMALPPENQTGLSDTDLAVATLEATSAERADDYWTWLQTGMALRSVNDGLLGEWDRWSQRSDKYVDGECAKKWASFRRGGLGIGSLIHWAKQNGWRPPSRPHRLFKLTDLGNAERFAEKNGDDVRYCHVWHKWYVWDGCRWKYDTMGEIARRAAQTIRNIYGEAANAETPELREAIAKFAAASERRERINATVAIAQSQEPIPIAVESLDVEPWLLNCQNGTIDLRTGELHEHRRSDFLTKLAPIEYPTEPGDDPVLWLSVLDRIFTGNNRLIDFLQRLFGASLAGEVLDHILPIFWGPGANGKTVVIESWCGMLGPDYAMKAPRNFLIAKRGESHPTELADLHGKRLVACVETADGERLSESLVKELTGGDSIRARRMREDFWQFRPTHSVVLATNHKPMIYGTDYAIWRRIRLVPFTVTIPEAEQDRKLAHKLRAEWSAILRWAVAGCLEWQRNGLQAPDDVLTATASYRSDSDTTGEFIDECCDVGAASESQASTLYKRYRAWSEDRGDQPANQTRFGNRLAERGFDKSKRKGRVWYRGIEVQVDSR